MPTDAKSLSPEVDAARQAAAAEKQRARDQAQAELASQNKEMKKRLAATGAVNSKGPSPEVQAARKAIAEDKQRAKDQAHAELDAENKVIQKIVAATGAADSARPSPEDDSDALPLSDAFSALVLATEVAEYIYRYRYVEPSSASILPAAEKYLACATFVPSSTTTTTSLDHKFKAAEAAQMTEVEAAARAASPRAAKPLRRATFVPSASTAHSLDEKFKLGAQNVLTAKPLRGVPPPPLVQPTGGPPPTPRRAVFLGGLGASGLTFDRRSTQRRACGYR